FTWQEARETGPCAFQSATRGDKNRRDHDFSCRDSSFTGSADLDRPEPLPNFVAGATKFGRPLTRGVGEHRLARPRPTPRGCASCPGARSNLWTMPGRDATMPLSSPVAHGGSASLK